MTDICSILCISGPRVNPDDGYDFYPNLEDKHVIPLPRIPSSNKYINNGEN